MKINKLLIANRGEIAVRIIRTCRDLGIPTVAVYSQADAKALHVMLADEAYDIGESSADASYLVSEKLLDVAKRAKANAIHPGYGFLSENADFAKACKANNILFVGPTPESIFAMGDKVRSRQIAEQAKVPVVPGSSAITSLAQAEAFIKQVGLPVLIKCSGGGGGHGMRLVEKLDQLEIALRLAAAEGKKSFDDATVYLEKALSPARHIEVQLFGLGDGQAVHCFTRACSVQRRHQKVIEEAPAPCLLAAQLRKMENDAVQLAKAISYLGAGTVEFLVDGNGQHYFLEMNTRLQVEHTVTEMILGLDLVALQLQAAQGEPLDSHLIRLHEKGQATHPRGHAMECRIYAEDPANNFAPAPGKILELRLPHGPYVRVDAGVERGFEIPLHYDPLIAKIITWGRNRQEARRRMQRALRETMIVGVTTNIAYLRAVLELPQFVNGDYAIDLLASSNVATNYTQNQQTLATTHLAVWAAGFVEAQQSQPLPTKSLSPWQVTKNEA